ncbi:MAG: PTS fructose transporter subunit IIA, partial [Rhodospirillales bacterium]
ILDRANVEVIAGINLPMLVKLASVRKTEPLAKAVEAAQEAGRKYINIASRQLTQEAR